MALEVWSEMQFRQKIYTKDAKVDGKINILPITKTNFPEFQGVEIYGGGIEIGSIYDYFYPNYRSGELSIGIIDSNGTPKEKVISYTGTDCPEEVGLDNRGTFLANGFELYDRSTKKTISTIWSPENNFLQFEKITTLMYAKNTPTQELSGSKEQFCIQLDSSNGAVTLRNVPNGNNETIFGGYVTLYRPTGMGSSETKFDTLYLNEYKSGSTSVGNAIKIVESRLDSLGFSKGSIDNANFVTSSVGSYQGTVYKLGKMYYIDLARNINNEGHEVQELYIQLNTSKIPAPKQEIGTSGIFLINDEYHAYSVKLNTTGKITFTGLPSMMSKEVTVPYAGAMLAWETYE